jgi:uncharacterized membrane protein YfcA
MLAQMSPLLGSLDLLTIFMVVGICVGAAAVSGMSGFGAGLIITLFITPIIGVRAVVPAMSVVMLINNLSRVWFFRTGLNWRMVRLVALPGVVTSVFGSMLYVRMESDLIQMVLGAFLILSIPLRRWLNARRWAPGDFMLVATGGVFGFLGSLMVGAGVLIVPLLLGAGLAGSALLATDAAIAVAVNVVKIAMFGRLEVLGAELFLLSVLMGLCTVPGTWVAALIVGRTSLRIHTALIETLLICGGAVMLIDAVR